MYKASQQNVMLALDGAFGKEIHFGVVRVHGVVGPEYPNRNPTNIAEKAHDLYEQKKGEWKFKVDITEPNE